MPLLFQMGYKNEFDIHMAFHLTMAIMSAKFDEDVPVILNLKGQLWKRPVAWH